MTVGDLKKIIDAAVDEDPNLLVADVIIRLSINDADDLFVGGLDSAVFHPGCTDTIALVLDGSDSTQSSST